jgi:uroporphyrinogen III methyltransferase/synthase
MVKTKGKVWLVGAGPGDPGLLTVKGQVVLKNADLVLYDNLVGKGIVSLIPPSAAVLFVGKSAGNHTMPQETINHILLENALLGKRVVRLKGGDPFLFGRGGEELEGLAEAGVAFEVVPGVSSPLAVPTYFGIPVTHRDCCSAVHIITAHGKAGAKPIEWEALVRAGGTFIFLMGSAALDEISVNLINAGMPKHTQAAILERGTTARQKKALATLENIVFEAKQAGIAPPALIIVGEVCAYAHTFSWVEKKPLGTVRIAVTRPRKRSAALSAALAEAGAEVVEIPVIAMRPRENIPALDRFFEELRGPSPNEGAGGGGIWLAFTSPWGVDVFFDKLRKKRLDIRALAKIRFAAIGQTTATALEARGIIVDLVPEHFSGADLARALKGAVKPGDCVLLPRSSIGSEELCAELGMAGIKYLDIPVYDTVPEDFYNPALGDTLCEDLDWIAFTSRSTVENFARIFGREKMTGKKALCIGEQTAKAAAEYGMETLIAENATVAAMIARLEKYVSGGNDA